jgi:uncharacterized coiled-coil protein SlyX
MNQAANVEAITEARAAVEKANKAVDNYVEKIQTLESSPNFTVDNADCIYFHACLKEATDILKEARAFYLRLSQPTSQVSVSQELLPGAQYQESIISALHQIQEELSSQKHGLERIDEKLVYVDEKLVSVEKKQNQIEGKIISVQGDVFDLNRKGENSQRVSASKLGKDELDALKDRGCLSEADDGEPGEESFWQEQNQADANAIQKEADFVKLITPFFNKWLQPFHMVFVNSENRPWLSQSESLTDKKTDLKPDGFATHRGMYRKRKKKK